MNVSSCFNIEVPRATNEGSKDLEDYRGIWWKIIETFYLRRCVSKALVKRSNVFTGTTKGC